MTPDVNAYLMLRDAARHQPQVALIFCALNETLDHFGVKEKADRERFGDLIQRWSMKLAEHGPMLLNFEDAGIERLADMVEWFQKHAEKVLAGG